MKFGVVLFSAYVGAVAYGFLIVWFGQEPLRTLQDYQTLLVGLPTLAGLAMAYGQWRDERSRYISDKEESYLQEREALEVALAMANFDHRAEMAEIGRYIMDERVAQLDLISDEELAFVVTHTKSYRIQQLARALADRLRLHSELAGRMNEREEEAVNETNRSKLTLHESVAKTASKGLSEVVEQRLAAINHRTWRNS